MPNKELSVRVIRSTKRTKSLSARRIGNVIEVTVPARLRSDQVAQAVEELVAAVKERTAPPSDTQLAERARVLNDRFLAGKARVTSIRWVRNQTKRWASCTPITGEIRVSHRLMDVPGYVLDAVIIHELVHTFVAGGHTEEFWSWADRAPHAERAKGYLEALSSCYEKQRAGQLVD